MTKRISIVVFLMVASWCAMAISHECGHIAGGLASGATLTDFDLAPWRMPYSLHSPDPYPLVTLWAGPVLGVLIPVVFAAIVRQRWSWFVADFCLLSNGVYLTLAWISGDPFLDTPRLLAAGASPVMIVMYCALAVGFGYTWFRADLVHYLFSASTPCDEK